MKSIKILIAFIVLISLPGLLNAQSSTVPSGTGSSGDPFQISSLENLYWLSQQSSASTDGKYYIQTVDIDASATSSWTNNWPTKLTFQGNYNGQNYSISNLTCSGFYSVGNYYRTGLFYEIGGGSGTTVVENLSILNSSYTFSDSSGPNGILSGSIKSDVEIDNITISGTLTSSSASGVGGLSGDIGYASDNVSLSNINSSVNIDAGDSNYSGGIIGEISSSLTNLSFDNLNYTGDIDGKYSVGGIFGLVSTGGFTLSNSSTTSVMTGSEYRAGGIIGEVSSLATGLVVNNCSSNVQITNSREAGGLIGYIGGDDVVVSNSYSSGRIENNYAGSCYSGGLIGYIAFENTQVSNCFSTADVVLTNAGGNGAGGLIGQVYGGSSSNAVISNSYASGNISGNNNISGFIGSADSNVSISYSYSIGSASGNSSVHGFTSSGPTISNSFWDTEASENSTSGGGTGKSTSEMQTASTFTNAGWDALGESSNGNDDYWNLTSSYNGGYPFLERSSSDPYIQFSLTGSNGLESVSSASLLVNLNKTSSSTISIDYSVTGGTATGSGTDYTLNSGTLNFSAGETTKNISLSSIINDATTEDDETIIVSLSSPVNAILGGNSKHTYTIEDDDGVKVQFNSSNSSNLESVSSTTIQVDLTFSSSDEITVNYELSGSAVNVPFIYEYDRITLINQNNSSHNGEYTRQSEISISSSGQWEKNGYFYFTHPSNNTIALVFKDDGFGGSWNITTLSSGDFSSAPTIGDSPSYIATNLQSSPTDIETVGGMKQPKNSANHGG